MKDGIIRQKRSLRFLLRARRREASLEDLGASVALSKIFLSNIEIPSQSVIGSYFAQGSEIDPAPLMEVLRLRGYSLAFPCTEEIDGSLTFRLYAAGDGLEKGPLSIPQPLTLAQPVEPDFFLVPLLGFDRQGRRLGQGSGYYDRLFTSLRLKKTFIAVGLAYAAQEAAEIPCAEHDQNLDGIVTEKEFIDPAV